MCCRVVMCCRYWIFQSYGYIDSNQRKERYKFKAYSERLFVVLSNSNLVFDKVNDWIPVSCLKIKVPAVFMISKIV